MLSAGIGTILTTGCRGFTGPVPPPLLIRQVIVNIQIYACRCQ